MKSSILYIIDMQVCTL